MGKKEKEKKPFLDNFQPCGETQSCPELSLTLIPESPVHSVCQHRVPAVPCGLGALSRRWLNAQRPRGRFPVSGG